MERNYWCVDGSLHILQHWFELAKEHWLQALRSTGTPCSCWMCRGNEYNRLAYKHNTRRIIQAPRLQSRLGAKASKNQWINLYFERPTCLYVGRLSCFLPLIFHFVIPNIFSFPSLRCQIGTLKTGFTIHSPLLCSLKNIFRRRRLFAILIPPINSIIKGIDSLADEIGVLGG